MKHTPELIVMLTHNDVTVPDAAAVFARCQHTRARYWGFKEEGLPFAEMAGPVCPDESLRQDDLFGGHRLHRA